MGKKRKNQPITKNVRKHAVRLVDDAFGIVEAAGNPARMYKVIRKTIKKRPAISAVAAITVAGALWVRDRAVTRDDAHAEDENRTSA